MKRYGKALLVLMLGLAAAVLLALPLIRAGLHKLDLARYPQKYQELVEQYALENQIDPLVIYSVIRTESGFDPDAVSDAGALGLTQITPETFEWLQTKTGETYSKEALHDPDVSVEYGALFYSLLLDEFGNDPKTAAAAYHAGRGQVNRWLQNPDYSQNGVTLDVIPTKDTNHYVHKVLKAMDIYSNLYEKELAEDV